MPTAPGLARGPAVPRACPQPAPNLAQAGGGQLAGSRGVTAVGCAPALFAPRALRLPASQPRARPPAPRAARGTPPTFWMVCCVTSPLPLGRADAKATDMVQARDQPEIIGVSSPAELGHPRCSFSAVAGGRGHGGARRGLVRPQRPPRCPRAHHRAAPRTPGPQGPAPRVSSRRSPRAPRPARRRTWPPPAPGGWWTVPAPPRSAHVRPTPPTPPTPRDASSAVGGAGRRARAEGRGVAAERR